MASNLYEREHISRQKISSVGGAVKRTAAKGGQIRFNIKRFLVSAAVFVFLIYFVCMSFGQQRVLNAKQREIDDLNVRIAAASAETDALNSELESVNEPEYLERMAREKLGLVQPNERVFIDVSSGKN